MAVKGKLGGQDIELNNAAEEATLQKILDLMQSGETKFDDANDKVKTFGDQVKKTSKSAEKVEGNFNELERSANKTKSGLEKFSEGLISHSKAIARSFKGIASDTEGFTNAVQTVITSIGDAMSSIPYVGGVLKGVAVGVAAGFGFLMGAAQKTADSFTMLADTGATFGNSMIAMRDAAHNAGIPLETFAKAVSTNISGLTRFAGSASAGARALSDAQRAIKSQNLDRSLMMMGVALKDQPEYMAQFLNDMSGLGIRASSFSGRMNDLAIMAVAYRKEMQIAKQLTGESNEEQQARMKALQKDAQLQAKLRGMTEDERVGFANLMKTVPAALQPAVKDLMLFGVVTKENAGLQAMFPQQLDAIRSSLSAGADAGGEYRRQLELRAGALAQEEENARQAIIVSGLSSSDALKQAAGAYIDITKQVDILKSGGIKRIVEETNKAATGIGADKLTDNMIEFQKTMERMRITIEEFATTFLKGGAFNKVVEGLVEGLQYILDQINGNKKTPTMSTEQQKTVGNILKEDTKKAEELQNRAKELRAKVPEGSRRDALAREAEQMAAAKRRRLESEIQLYERQGFKVPKSLADQLKSLQESTNSPRRQYGGPVIPGIRYLVGESGPELFEPDETGEIKSNNALRPQNPVQESLTPENEILIHLKKSNELMEKLVSINQRGFDEEQTLLTRISRN